MGRRYDSGLPVIEVEPAHDSVVVESVSVTFPARSGPVQALRDMSFTVRRGEFVTILGRSGCGKSTLFNAVAGLLDVTSGIVRVDGRVVNGRPGHCGYMMQRDHLFPWRNVLDNVVVGLDVLGNDRAQSRKRARSLFPRFGLEGFERAYPSALSGGMRQRAALLRTMLLDRDLLLLDEPFGALDAITRAAMQSWLLEIWQEFRHTILFITHDVEEAVFLGDRVLVMAGPPGRPVALADVALPRPRVYADAVTSPEFMSIKHRLLDLVATDVR